MEMHSVILDMIDVLQDTMVMKMKKLECLFPIVFPVNRDYESGPPQV
jgi:hypothetical protein